MEDSKNKIQLEGKRCKWLIVSQHAQLCDLGNLRKNKVEIASYRRTVFVNRRDFHNCICFKKVNKPFQRSHENLDSHQLWKS